MPLPLRHDHGCPSANLEGLGAAGSCYVERRGPLNRAARESDLPPFPSSHASVIGYFAKISSARLKALPTACSRVIPLFMTSSMAMLKTCSESTCAYAGLNA